MRKLFYLGRWFFNARFMGVKRPLQSVLFVSDRCNLTCKHCNVYNLADPHTKTMQEIAEELKYCYGRGSRFVDFEGGEPFLWKENGRDINDLIRLAKAIGFFSTTVTTNAQLPFADCAADSIWVSLDGLGRYHDEIRGRGAFERLEKNVATCGHKALNFNMVINSRNYPSVEETIEYARKHPAIQAISLNFHTPWKGTEELFLDWDIREKMIDRIIEMKKSGYPVINSVSGLKLMKRNTFRKQCWVSNFILADGARLNECPGESAGICNECGLCMAGEMHSIFTFKPDTLFAGMKLRM